MPRLAAAAAGLVAAAVVMVRYLPRLVASVRRRIFLKTDTTLVVPGPSVGAEYFQEVYRHPAARQRRHGAALSDLHFLWFGPQAGLHPENLEHGALYDELAPVTRALLSVTPEETTRLAHQCMGTAVHEAVPRSGIHAVRLRDVIAPGWAEFFFRLLFDEPCPAEVRSLITSYSANLFDTIKASSRPKPSLAEQLDAVVLTRLPQLRKPLRTPSLTSEEQAAYLRLVFFGSGVGQMTEATTHVCMALASDDHLQSQLAADPGNCELLGSIINETLRMYPLFGFSHRILTQDITLSNGRRIPQGTVVCFDYPSFQRAGLPAPDTFRPGRWTSEGSPVPENFTPFGVPGARSCPARGLATSTLPVAITEIVTALVLATSAGHPRSLANRGPCLVWPRTDPPPRHLASALRLHRAGDSGATAALAAKQLVLTWRMVRLARLQHPCARHYASLDALAQPGVPSSQGRSCPRR
ncbi:cytochrome P450 (plasmid) [Kitasatospora sp. NBC_00070]|uniref:cytochrome P450 n=1 Tax=Kitasatospora sp. NBC_00070 TaxID=2975962 RepID=UPI002F908505